jgi:hypothetical protein
MYLGYCAQHNNHIFNVDRFANTHLIGKRRTGKTTLLSKWIIDDINEGAGIALFDAYGDCTEQVLSHIPPERIGDVVLVEPHDSGFPVAINPLYQISRDDRSKVVRSIVNTFKSISGYTNIATPVLDDFLSHSISALLDYQHATLVGLKWLFTSTEFRQKVLRQINDPVIQDFWKSDFEMLSERSQVEATQSTLNKIRAFTSDPISRNILGQSTPTIVLKDILAEGKIMIVNMPIGKLGIETTKLLGSLLMGQLHHEAVGRSGAPFYVYVDGCNYFAPATQVQMLDTPYYSQVGYTFSHQYLDQLDSTLQVALIGSVGTLFGLQCGVVDSERLEKEFQFSPQDIRLYELSAFNARVSTGGRGFPVSFRSLGEGTSDSLVIRRQSRNRYAKQRAHVEARLQKFIQPLQK